MKVTSLHKPRNKTRKNKTKRLNRFINNRTRKYKNKRTNRRMKKRLVTKKYKRTKRLKQTGKQKGWIGGDRKVPDIAINLCSNRDYAEQNMELVHRIICGLKYTKMEEKTKGENCMANRLHTGFFEMVPGGPIFLHLPDENISVNNGIVRLKSPRIVNAKAMVDGRPTTVPTRINSIPLINYYWEWIKSKRLRLNNQRVDNIHIHIQYKFSNLFYMVEDGFGYFENYRKSRSILGKDKRSFQKFRDEGQKEIATRLAFTQNPDKANQQWSFLMALCPLIYASLYLSRDYHSKVIEVLKKAICGMLSSKVQTKFQSYKSIIPFETITYDNNEYLYPYYTSYIENCIKEYTKNSEGYSDGLNLDDIFSICLVN